MLGSLNSIIRRNHPMTHMTKSKESSLIQDLVEDQVTSEVASEEPTELVSPYITIEEPPAETDQGTMSRDIRHESLEQRGSQTSRDVPESFTMTPQDQQHFDQMLIHFTLSMINKYAGDHIEIDVDHFTESVQNNELTRRTLSHLLQHVYKILPVNYLGAILIGGQLVESSTISLSGDLRPSEEESEGEDPFPGITLVVTPPGSDDEEASD